MAIIVASKLQLIWINIKIKSKLFKQELLMKRTLKQNAKKWKEEMNEL